MGCSKSNSKREVYSNTILPQETRKTLNRLTLHVKQEEKEEQKHPKISRRKEIIKIWAEIKEKEKKEATVKVNKTKSWFFEKINKIDKPLVRVTKEKKRKFKLTQIEMKKKLPQTIQKYKKIIRDYYQKLYANKMDKLE